MPEYQIKTALRATSAVTALAGSRIRCGLLDEADARPAIGITADRRPLNCSTGSDGLTYFATVFVRCHGETYDAARDLADVVRATLDGYSVSGSAVTISETIIRDIIYDPGPAVPGRDAVYEAFTLECSVNYSLAGD